MYPIDYDSLWKDVIEDFFEDFLLFFAPDLCEKVETTKGFEFLEQELTQLSKDTETNKKLMDKLVKVYLKDGRDQWILVHIEVQGDRQKSFSKRMFQYFYRTLDKYDRTIYAIAIFTDASKQFNPNEFRYKFFETELTYLYKTYKIIDQDEEALEKSFNPFALAILAGIYVVRSKKKLDQKFLYKLKLTRLLLSKEWTKEHIDKLFRFIDGILRLDEDLGLRFKKEVDVLLENKGGADMGLTWDKTNLAEIYWNKGKAEGKIDIAKQMLLKGYLIKDIHELTGLPLAEIEKLKETES